MTTRARPVAPTPLDLELHALDRTAALLSGPLLPLEPPRGVVDLDQLPAIERRGSHELPFGPELTSWRCSTHVVPAAFPRSIPGSTMIPGQQREVGEREKTKEDVVTAYRKMLLAQIEGTHQALKLDEVEKAKEEQERLNIVLNRYYRTQGNASTRDEEDGLTLVVCHANGFCKEIWEPFLSDLLTSLGSDPSTRPIIEIWALDIVVQGDSALLNEGLVGPTINLADLGRDLLNFLISYLPPPFQPPPSSQFPLSPIKDLDPTLLSLDSPRTSSLPRPFRNRTLVGLGHSVGGNTILYAATSSPSLFSSLILIDPLLIFEPGMRTGRYHAQAALSRQDRWTDRTEAKAGWKRNKMMGGRWDERVLEVFVEKGLIEDEEGVRLKARKEGEARMFCDPFTSSLKRLSTRLLKTNPIPSSLPVHFIFADRKYSITPGEEMDRAREAIPHASWEMMEKQGHLVLLERPKECAERVGTWLRGAYLRGKDKARL